VKLSAIVNPTAGSVNDLDLLQRNIGELNPSYVYVTGKTGDARDYAIEALGQGCDCIVAAGGDGTLNEVVNGIGEDADRVRLGLIPLGTGNDFARCLNLPLNVEENIAILLAGETIAIDLVRVHSDVNRYFINVSAGGFSGMVDEKLTPEIKRTWGPLAYVRGAAAAFPELHGYHTSIALGEEEALSADLYNVIVANGRFVAGGLPIAPDADPTDGLLDIILIPKLPKAEIALLAAQILLGKHIQSNGVTFRRTRKISIRSQPGMCFNVDGELVGHGPATFEVIPRALQFVVRRQ
jgi:diacylglycerol kinase (ATP)